MSYEMSRLRKEDLSLYYFIKDQVLGCFIEQEELIPLNYVSELSSVADDSLVYEVVTTMEPSPTERGRGWVYFDTVTGTNNLAVSCPTDDYVTVTGTRHDGVACIGTPEQSSRIVVYDANSTVISGADSYIIDYTDGRIITTTTATTPVYVGYYWNYVSVVDEWSAIEAADPPVVVIDMSETQRKGYQLGGGEKIIRKVDVHVFASNPAERNDMVETLHKGLYLKSCPLYDFPTGGALDYDGTFYGRRDNTNKLTSLFSRETFNGSSMLQMEDVIARHVNLPLVMTRTSDQVMLSDLNAYRSKVSFNLVSYT